MRYLRFFLNQPTRNNIPIKKATPEICIIQASIYHSICLFAFLTFFNFFLTPLKIFALEL
ncbi:hypothetical protein COU23_01480 [Candidatus Kuenenbacteria bacterium CG10_big_fil_rev_8_21_14_0_10_36_11]|uniref:Uncharacterized protein n=1 Tax=Candidatus Kuenenbacteria bacterium CG10_big_fil_rev_8_21_14_0_10_36_11 TaxID=1974618 RepID=A0A2M6WAU1_9BACT|nr:MAG: hypothetical protein COU23_01480 [Candidatus Kuenenbacteria bacterium CG10_big_fil_rev_8_21_14_0_10_36_11]